MHCVPSVLCTKSAVVSLRSFLNIASCFLYWWNKREVVMCSCLGQGCGVVNNAFEVSLMCINDLFLCGENVKIRRYIKLIRLNRNITKYKC